MRTSSTPEPGAIGRNWLAGSRAIRDTSRFELSTEKLVVLDEIGADRDKNGHVKDQLARLCSARVGKWTIITSNMTLEDVKTHLDQRIPSRMLRDGSVVVDVRMRDYNLRK